MILRLLAKLFGGSQNDAVLADVLAKKPLLLDVRTASEFAGGSVAGAKNVPLQELPSRLAELRGHPTIVVFCRSGGRAGMAKPLLENNGVTTVINGGSWQNVAAALGA